MTLIVIQILEKSSQGKKMTDNQSISTNSNDNLLQHFLTFQLVFINFNIIFPSSSQVSSTLFKYCVDLFIPNTIKYFLQLSFFQIFHSYNIIYLDYEKLLSEPGNLLNLIRNLIYRYNFSL